MPAASAIRPAIGADVPAIAAIYAAAVVSGTGSFETEPPTVEEMTSRHARITGAGYPWLVATCAAKVVGFAYAGPFRDRPAYRFTVEDSVYVEERARRQGVARLLLSSLIEAAEAAGFRQMVALVGDSRNVASIRLHEACGFERSGIMRDAGWKQGVWLDVVLMQRTLGAGGTTVPR